MRMKGREFIRNKRPGRLGGGQVNPMHTHLQAVADPQNGHTKLKDVMVDVGGIMVIN
jgi:hypothetical protein